MIKLNFVSTSVANKLNAIVSKFGIPSENRVLILTPNQDTVTSGGIIIPGTAKEDLPRKGVVIQVGSLDETYKSYKDLLQIGMVVTYGLYAGKEIEFNNDLGELGELLKSHKFTVLSVNEIIYAETND